MPKRYAICNLRCSRSCLPCLLADKKTGEISLDMYVKCRAVVKLIPLLCISVFAGQSLLYQPRQRRWEPQINTKVKIRQQKPLTVRMISIQKLFSENQAATPSHCKNDVQYKRQHKGYVERKQPHCVHAHLVALSKIQQKCATLEGRSSTRCWIACARTCAAVFAERRSLEKQGALHKNLAGSSVIYGV